MAPTSLPHEKLTHFAMGPLQKPPAAQGIPKAYRPLSCVFGGREKIDFAIWADRQSGERKQTGIQLALNATTPVTRAAVARLQIVFNWILSGQLGIICCRRVGQGRVEKKKAPTSSSVPKPGDPPM